MRRLFCILSLMGMSTAVAADVPLVARLELSPNHTLPGIPVMFSVSVTNPNNTSKTLYQFVELSATDVQGQTFHVRWGNADGDFLVKPFSETTTTILAPGATVNLFVPTGAALIENAAFYDERLCLPGTYDLQMTIGTEKTKTNVARLTVDMPVGDDLLVWKAATANHARLTAYNWTSLGAAIHYPASNYYKLLVFHMVSSEKPEDTIRALQNALAGGVPAPLHDEFTLQIAHYDSMIAQAAAERGDFVAAAAALRDANAAVRRVLDHPANDFTRSEAVTTGDAVQHTSTMIDIKKTKRPVTLWRPMKPFVQCRTTDGRIQFGYTSSNETVVHVAVGKRNRFDPEPSDRGQVTEFRQGTHRKAATVPLLVGERKLNWMLDGTSATFSLDGPAAKTCDETDDDETD